LLFLGRICEKEKYKFSLVIYFLQNPDGRTMKKNENIYISLELQKDLESKGLLLSVQFDRNAPNFFEGNGMLSWCPTSDELSFIKESFDLIGGNNAIVKQPNKTEEVEESPLMMETAEYSHRSSEIRIAPLPNNMTLEVEESTGSRQKDREDEEKIFIQADEKKIDEILNRKKNAEKEQADAASEDKELVDKIMRQKKKK
jgi:hypothetical protein